MEMSAPLRDWLTWAFSPSLSAILLTLLISILSPLLFHYYLYRKSTTTTSTHPTFLLLGPSNSGKTTLLTYLTTSTPTPTHTSQTPQTALITLPSTTPTSQANYRSEHDPLSPTHHPRRVLMTDTPGHGKLRHHAFTALTTHPSLAGIIFLLDSSSPSFTEAAEYLHDVLLLLQKRYTQGKSSKGAGGGEVHVLVAAGKQDVFSSLPAGLVRGRVEEEVGRVRGGRGRRLADSAQREEGEEEEEVNWLGTFGSQRFGFEEMREHGVHVSVLGGSVKEGDVKVEEWWGWIGENS